MPGYKSTPLFGGALICDLPEKFTDVRYASSSLDGSCPWQPVQYLTQNEYSKLRQVPDNQEVYIDQDGFTSIIFEITERVGEPGSSPEIDGKAMTTHLEDIVGSDFDTVKVWNTKETMFSRLAYDDFPNPFDEILLTSLDLIVMTFQRTL
jgi:Ran-interacting Mog1 protein